MIVCRLCRLTDAFDDFPVVNRVARYEYPQVSVVCPRCRLVQVDPLPPLDEVERYYASGEYRREFPPLAVDGVEPDDARYDAALDRRAYETMLAVVALGKISGIVAPRVHEVGCGDGRVAHLLSRALSGSLVSAGEADPAMRDVARVRGVAVDPESFPTDGGVDLLYSLQVLEHCVEPIEVLRGWQRLLSRGGRVHVEVPTLERMYGGASHFFQRPHLVNFTSRTLALSMLRAGLAPLVVGLSGSVLFATAERLGDGSGLSYEDAERAISLPPDDPAALIAAHEASRSERRRIVPRHLVEGVVEVAEVSAPVRIGDIVDRVVELARRKLDDAGE